MALYGWLVGHWQFDAVAFEESGVRHDSRGEIHAGWVLEGRAIQDVWMIPPRQERRGTRPPAFPVTGAWYGTTLRVYDPALDAWHIFWNDPATQFYTRMIGRARDADIVQEGTLPSGALLRWSFTDITSRSFRWRSEMSVDRGQTWRLQVDIAARRAGAH
ncbi:MAG: hypothetical protein ACRETT_07005 [Steroidobacteraceae bacterium]